MTFLALKKPVRGQYFAKNATIFFYFKRDQNHLLQAKHINKESFNKSTNPVA